MISIAIVWLGAFMLLWLPGVALQRLLRVPFHADWLVALALQIGLGMAWWPLLLLWSTTLGLTWSPPVARVAILALLLGGAAALLWVSRQAWQRRLHSLAHQAVYLTVWCCVAVLAIATRLLQIRSLALPAWVDSVHHVALVRLIVAQGQLPATLDPFVPGGALTYHWGFHAVAAWLAWLLGTTDAFAIADLVLQVGQIFNVLAVLMLYAAARVLFASRRAGLLAAVSAACITWFPAYFVTWGRYTHLAGVLLLLAALIGLWQLRHHLRRGYGAQAAILIAGLALVHVRLAFFGGVAVAILALLLTAQRRWRALALWAASGAACSAAYPPLVAPAAAVPCCPRPRRRRTRRRRLACRQHARLEPDLGAARRAVAGRGDGRPQQFAAGAIRRSSAAAARSLSTRRRRRPGCLELAPAPSAPPHAGYLAALAACLGLGCRPGNPAAA